MTSRMQSFIFACVGSVLPTVALTQEDLFNYRPFVELHVGDSTIVHGLAGECGKIPERPDKDTRKTDLGALTLGQLGQRGSARCNGITPAIAVIFTALLPGKEQIELFGDTIEITINQE